MMTITEIVTRFEDHTLADQPDARLEDSRSMLDRLTTCMLDCDQRTLTLPFREPITTDKLQSISDFVTKTLNTRDGCND